MESGIRRDPRAPPAPLAGEHTRKERKVRMKELRFGALRGMSSLWTQQEPPQAEQEAQQESGTYSQEDVERLLAQKEAEWQSRQEAAVQAARSEAERLLSMTDEERAQEQQREAELVRREEEVARRELRAQAVQELAARQLPAELVDLLDYTDAERCAASMETVGRLFRQAVQQGVERRVAGSAPRSGSDRQGRSASLRDAISEHYSV